MKPRNVVSAPPVGPSATERAACMNVLARVLEADFEVCAASISTVDGFEVASVSQPGTSSMHGGRLSAVTSSLQSLGMAATAELELGRFESVTIESTAGRMLTVGIQDGVRTYLLAIVVKKPSLLGQSLLKLRDCANQIAAALAVSKGDGASPSPWSSTHHQL